jgi:hypothetical protein
MKSIIIGSLIAFSLVFLLSSASAYVTCDPDSQVNDTLTGNLTTVAGACTNHDGGCLTGWECQNGVAVHADYVPQALIDNPESAAEAGYHSIPGKYCYANPKTMPDCSSTVVNVPSLVQEVATPAVESQQPEVEAKLTFWQKIKSFFGVN